jgi:hypothetical protein
METASKLNDGLVKSLLSFTSKLPSFSAWEVVNGM